MDFRKVPPASITPATTPFTLELIMATMLLSGRNKERVARASNKANPPPPHGKPLLGMPWWFYLRIPLWRGESHITSVLPKGK
ncbi:jg3702 [Pararge aegeria aegeria]|uniref:Jg3702 protein n=1 Tax=Pararge aegeria aegeria TaxID=348720 RepID=A0A8S4S5X8_9NEOP|nr:jg3702 [Pararge aegeria aegeria]